MLPGRLTPLRQVQTRKGRAVEDHLKGELNADWNQSQYSIWRQTRAYCPLSVSSLAMFYVFV